MPGPADSRSTYCLHAPNVMTANSKRMTTRPFSKTASRNLYCGSCVGALRSGGQQCDCCGRLYHDICLRDVGWTSGPAALKRARNHDPSFVWVCSKCFRIESPPLPTGSSFDHPSGSDNSGPNLSDAVIQTGMQVSGTPSRLTRSSGTQNRSTEKPNQLTWPLQQQQHYLALNASVKHQPHFNSPSADHHDVSQQASQNNSTVSSPAKTLQHQHQRVILQASEARTTGDIPLMWDASTVDLGTNALHPRSTELSGLNDIGAGANHNNSTTDRVSVCRPKCTDFEEKVLALLKNQSAVLVQLGSEFEKFQLETRATNAAMSDLRQTNAVLVEKVNYLREELSKRSPSTTSFETQNPSASDSLGGPAHAGSQKNRSSDGLNKIVPNVEGWKERILNVRNPRSDTQDSRHQHHRHQHYHYYCDLPSRTRCLKEGIPPVPGPLKGDDEGFEEDAAGPSHSPPQQPGSSGGTPDGGAAPTPMPRGNPGGAGPSGAANFDMGLPDVPQMPRPPKDERTGAYPKFPPAQQPPAPAPMPSPMPPVAAPAFVPPPVLQPGQVPKLDVNQRLKAQKYCKFATSALTYEDVPTAVLNLHKALALLTTGVDPES